MVAPAVMAEPVVMALWEQAGTLVVWLALVVMVAPAVPFMLVVY
jgi:hypothetical protein